MEIQINELIIEVTRKCNFYCQHCLRGDAQNISIDTKYVENIFKKIQSIDCIVFTGGEPQLATNKIREILDLAKKYHIDIRNFYVATNGAVNSKEFALLMMEWYMFCSDNDISAVQVSMDYYHQLESGIDYDSLWLSNLKFVDKRDEKKQLDNDFISQGNWEGKSKNTVKSNKLTVECYGDPDNVTIGSELYLNAKGDIISGCDFSYKNQNKHIIGNAREEWMMLVPEQWEKFVSVDDWIQSELSEVEIIDD
jgi:organic radical activating enzyme